MSLIPFTFEDHPVRVIERDGVPWFVLGDVCSVLEHSNSRMMAERLDDDEKGVSIADTLGGPQGVTIINESGLWSLVLTSRKEAAKRFKKWVTADVIPSIRKTGSYGVDPMKALNDPVAMRGLLLTYSEKVLALEAQNAELTPKADALDRIADAEGSLCITDAAKTLQTTRNALFRWLRSCHWIYRRVGATHDVGYQSKIASGYLIHKVETYTRADGTEGARTQVRVTPKGIAVLAQAFPPAVAAA